MYGLFTIKYGKSFLVQQFRIEDEAKKKYVELESIKSSEKEKQEYFIRKI